MYVYVRALMCVCVVLLLLLFGFLVVIFVVVVVVLFFVVVFRGYLNYACNSVSVNETCTITGETMYVFAYFVISSFISCERLDNQTFS